MRTSKKASLDFYDESTDEHMVAEYYRIEPEEKYEGDFNDDYVEMKFEVPDFYPTCPSLQSPRIILAYRATVDQPEEIPELITDIKNSKYKNFEVHAQEICYEKFLKALRNKIPDLRFDVSKVKNGYFFFKMEF